MFSDYLKQQRYTQGTINTYCYLVNQYLTYEDLEDSEETEVNYDRIIKYIRRLKRKNSDRSVNLNLVALRHYFNYKQVEYNPIKLHIKRKPTLISTVTFTQSQLDDIYDEFSNDNVRDKVLLGLFVYQGIQSHEVKHLTVDDIDMTKLTITIPQSHKSNIRILPLNIKQVILLNQYLTVNRNELLKNRKDSSLIITSRSKNCTRSILNNFNTKLRNLTYRPNIRVIRTSVIKNWLKVHDLRKTQYLAGHKYISSTQSYETKDIEHLKKSVVQFHPL